MLTQTRAVVSENLRGLRYNRALPELAFEFMSCLFCRIVAGEIPAQIIYRDENAVAFRDINPQAPTHVLVIPVAHIASLNEAEARDAALLGSLLHAAARVAAQEGLAANGYRTVINTGAQAGQTVFHLHLHVLGGRGLRWPPG